MKEQTQHINASIIGYTRWNADGHPMQYDIEGGHRHYLYWDGLGNHLYTSYETAVTSPAAGQIAGRTRRTSVRTYSGDGHVLRGGAGNSTADTLEMLRFACGYFDANLRVHYLIADYLGANIAVIDEHGTLVQSTSYYPYGTPHRAPRNLTATSSPTTNAYLFGGKELMTQDALDEYLYGARTYLPAATVFSSIDPLCEKYYHLSPYTFCAANPIRYTDPSGMVLVLTGDCAAVDKTVQLYNKMVGDGATIYINDDGSVQISRTEKTSTEAEERAINMLNSAVDDEQTTTINIVDNSSEILIGDASKRTIDIGDIQALGDNAPTSSSAALLHETNEQFLVQAKGVELFKAHNSSIQMEAKYTGYAPFSTEHTDYSATFSGSFNNVPGQPRLLSQRHVRIGQPFGEKGSVMTTLVLFLNGNVNSKMYFK